MLTLKLSRNIPFWESFPIRDKVRTMKKSALCKDWKRTSQTPTFVHIKMDPVRWNFISKTVKNTKQSSNWDCWCWSPWDSRGRWCSRARWWRGSSATWWGAEWRRTPSASSHRSCQRCGRCRSRRSSYRTPPLNPRNQYDVPLSVSSSTYPDDHDEVTEDDDGAGEAEEPENSPLSQTDLSVLTQLLSPERMSITTFSASHFAPEVARLSKLTVRLKTPP